MATPETQNSLTISEIVEGYKNSVDSINTRRDIWKSNTRQLIASTLQEIANDFKIGWHVQNFSSARHLDTVNICFPTSNSGIVVENDKETRALVKHGGYLAFSTLYNGNVSVFVAYPYIEDHISKLPTKLIERIAPDKITAEYIKAKVEYFLREMTAWETGGQLDISN